MYFLTNTVSHQNDNILMEMILKNYSNTTISDFAILLNKNMFGLRAEPLQCRDLKSGQSSNVSVELVADDTKVSTVPWNSKFDII
jgi:hypothetical protein